KKFHKDFNLNIEKNIDSKSLINLKILNKISIIWQILIPNFFNKNSYLLILKIFFLISRTYLSLLITKLDGQIVKDIISGNFKGFLMDLIYWFLIAFPASYTNSSIKYLTKSLALNFRTNLIRYIHDIYLDDKMSNSEHISKYNPNSINNPKNSSIQKLKIYNSNVQNIDDITQFITNDITKFCNTIASLFSNLGKPIMDIVFFAIYLRDNLGTFGIVGLFLNYVITAYILRKNTPNFAKLVNERQNLESEYYNYHLNLINNSEEISLYNGIKIEKLKITEIFNKLVTFIDNYNRLKLGYTFLENYILKFSWSASGYLFASIPLVKDLITNNNKKINKYKNPKEYKLNQSKNMRQFIINKRLMLSVADAGSRLMYSIKDISTLTGYTNRIFDLLTLLHKAHKMNFNYGDRFSNDIKGTIQDDYNGLRCEKLSVIIPSPKGSEGVCLINKLSFQIKPNQNLLILGFNGSGKTSIQRIIAGLWPLYRGLLSKPNDNDILYVPQRPYFTNGTLRDQIIYPLNEFEMMDLGYTDNDLIAILKEVKLDYLLKRNYENNSDSSNKTDDVSSNRGPNDYDYYNINNFNAIKEWKDLLSGGEKQRIGFARILFKNPKFIILDESTNAISREVEDHLFDLLKSKKITYITLSHRPLLIKYHDQLIKLHKHGEWEFETLGTDAAIESIEKEIQTIDMKLKQVEYMQTRKIELNDLLNSQEDDESD
ncbi:uncharacterized protein ASCRUDRAFT_20148, partial [Ascoidea rubescens DSM 1968]